MKCKALLWLVSCYSISLLAIFSHFAYSKSVTLPEEPGTRGVSNGRQTYIFRNITVFKASGVTRLIISRDLHCAAAWDLPWVPRSQILKSQWSPDSFCPRLGFYRDRYVFSYIKREYWYSSPYHSITYPEIWMFIIRVLSASPESITSRLDDPVLSFIQSWVYQSLLLYLLYISEKRGWGPTASSWGRF